MMLIGSWGSRSLTAQSGKSDGGLAGRTGGVIKKTGDTRRCVRILYKYCSVYVA